MSRNWSAKVQRLLGSSALAGAAMLTGVSVGVSTALVTDAHAQDLKRNEEVRDRPRPEYDALGLLARPVLIYPTASIGLMYDDNVFASNADEQDDIITRLKVGLFAKTTWSRHALYGNLGVKYDGYGDNSDESGAAFDLYAGGVVNATRRLSFSGEVGYKADQEGRNNVDTLNVATEEPVDYQILRAEGAVELLPQPVGIRFAANVRDFDYDNARLIGGGTSIQDTRDKVVTEIELRGSVAVSPDAGLYLETIYNDRNYDLGKVGGLPDRDSTGYQVNGGVTFKLGPLAKGAIGAGYFEQSYDDDATLEDVDGFNFDLGLTVTPTQLLTFKLFGGREIVDGSDLRVGGYIRTNVGTMVDWEVARNAIVSFNLGYSDDDYENDARSEDELRTGLSAEIFINRYVGLTGYYQFEDHGSDTTAREYQKNVVGFSVNMQL